MKSGKRKEGQGRFPEEKRRETYLPLSRGWRDHLPILSGNAVKLYNLLLIDAKFSGPYKGRVSSSFRELARELGIHKTSVIRAIRELQPHYIAIDPAKNQHTSTVITVKRYKAITDFSRSGNATSNKSAGRDRVPTKAVPAAKTDHHVSSTAPKPSGQCDLLRPNKEEKQVEEEATSAAGKEWAVLGLSRPIGPPGFQRLWKDTHSRRNGHPISELMEECIQAWYAEGRSPPPPFFSAKRHVEQCEREKKELRECEMDEIPPLVVPG